MPDCVSRRLASLWKNIEQTLFSTAKHTGIMKRLHWKLNAEVVLESASCSTAKVCFYLTQNKSISSQPASIGNKWFKGFFY